MLVYGPGRYTFWTSCASGSGLTLVTFAVSLLIVPHVCGRSRAFGKRAVHF